MVGASAGSVTTWRKKHDRDGPAALASTPHPGPVPRLDDDRVTVLLARGRRLTGTPTTCGRWTGSRRCGPRSPPRGTDTTDGTCCRR
jgi:transposase